MVIPQCNNSIVLDPLNSDRASAEIPIAVQMKGKGLSRREGEGQEARAEQHKSGCSQGQETVGDKVMMAHVTPSLSDARPNELKLSERAH